MKVLDIVKALSEKNPNPVYTEFIDWFTENRDRLPEACQELGVEAPQEGPHLFRRIQEAVIPVLEREKF